MSISRIYIILILKYILTYIVLLLYYIQVDLNFLFYFMDKEPINICICADNHIIYYSAPLMLSIVENTSADIVFHILCNKENWGITDLRKVFDKYIAQNKHALLFNLIDTTSVKGLPKYKNLWEWAYYRLLIDQYLLDENKALYLDIDMISRWDILSLYNEELNGKDLGIAPYIHIKTDSIRNYNSGMMLMDLNKWREKWIGENVIKYIRDSDSNTILTDEGGINALIEAWKIDIQELSHFYNDTFRYDKINVPNYKLLSKHKPELSQIIHFLWNSKPWDWKNINPFSPLWHEYNNKCNW